MKRRDLLKYVAGIPFLGFLPKVEGDEIRSYDRREISHKLYHNVKFYWYKSPNYSEIDRGWAKGLFDDKHLLDCESYWVLCGGDLRCLRSRIPTWLEEKYQIAFFGENKAGYAWWGPCVLVRDIYYKRTSLGWTEHNFDFKIGPVPPKYYICSTEQSKKGKSLS